MRIIPVIDLKDGIVVRGVAGQRELYRPVESVLGCQATAHAVANAFVSRFGFPVIYVADLDAIAGAEPNWAAYGEIASAGVRLLVDAGADRVDRASALLDGRPDDRWLDGLVVGLESLRHDQDLVSLCAAIGPARAVFSLDLRHGQPVTEISNWRHSAPIELVDAAVTAGFERLIVLDLASVGLDEGVSVRELCASIRSRHPHLEITSGGGVRDRQDVAGLLAAGCDAALIASALHNGRLSRQDLSGFG